MGWNFSKPRKLSLHWNTTSPRRLTLLELERRTLWESLTESAAWLGSRFSGIGAYASVRSNNAGEELVFAYFFDNQVDGKLTLCGINGVAC